MPQEALPVMPAPISQRATLRREYFDPLMRPMSGKVTITGSAATREGSANVVPVAVTLPLVNGVLEAFLPPDTYTLEADLWTADDVNAKDTTTVTVGGEVDGR